MRFTKWSYRNNEQPLNCFSKDVTLVTPDRMLGRQWPPLSRVVDAPVAECVKSRRTEIRQMSTLLEFGLDTFGDITKDAAGTLLPQAQVIRNVIDEAVLADELEIDFIGLGEHHRLCYLLARGSFTESFPLFGFDLRQYEELFEEKLDLFAALLKQEAVTWQGKLRPQ